jgi:hypothetical protein
MVRQALADKGLSGPGNVGSFRKMDLLRIGRSMVAQELVFSILLLYLVN